MSVVIPCKLEEVPYKLNVWLSDPKKYNEDFLNKNAKVIRKTYEKYLMEIFNEVLDGT